MNKIDELRDEWRSLITSQIIQFKETVTFNRSQPLRMRLNLAGGIYVELNWQPSSMTSHISFVDRTLGVMGGTMMDHRAAVTITDLIIGNLETPLKRAALKQFIETE